MFAHGSRLAEVTGFSALSNQLTTKLNIYDFRFKLVKSPAILANRYLCLVPLPLSLLKFEASI
jgi:hypothetical protein